MAEALLKRDYKLVSGLYLFIIIQSREVKIYMNVQCIYIVEKKHVHLSLMFEIPELYHRFMFDICIPCQYADSHIFAARCKTLSPPPLLRQSYISFIDMKKFQRPN